ncbi:TetR/AcrR family transcriptional regulator [Nocardioides marinquilinus]|uniref:TetR/AcrR family transcriptional regulator n=1 Tax=Nocardioides marinquilinus TaxID=1210400 RepID=A0ABP9PPQ2_9ACTN
MTAQTARATARAELTRDILASAAAQLAETGPAALSVRAVARDLGMASSAVYRYFPSRDALLTALLVDAFDDLGAAVEDAEARVRRGDLRRRWRAAAHAVRDWAREHPHEYALAYGSPVPGYAAPTDTVEPAMRAARVVLGVVADAQAAGRSPAAGPSRVARGEKAALEPVASLVDPPLSPAYAVRGLMAWSALLGHVSLELFGHLHNGVLDYDEHFATLVDQLAADLGLR